MPYNARHLFSHTPGGRPLMKHPRWVVPCAAMIAALVATSMTGRGRQPGAAPPAGPFDTLHFRQLGPASMSGRISDVAVYEANPAIFYVATAHGGVWKTTSTGHPMSPARQAQG